MDLTLSSRALDFRAEFEKWIATELPNEWRDVPVGTGVEADYVAMRRDWGQKLHRDRWLAPHWPVEYGGRGLGLDEQLAFVEVLVAAGAPEPLNLNGIGIFAPALMRFGTGDQKRRWLEPMLAHEEVWCQGFSEPNAGSDLLGLRTVAEPHEGGWRITGQKVWTSYAAYSKFCYLLARVADSGITMFVAEIDQSAVTVRPLRNLSGTSEFCEVFFDGAFVPAEHVVGPVGSGWAAARYALSCERSTSLAQRALLLVREFDKLAELVARVSSDRDWADSFVDAFVRSRVVESFVKRVQATVAGGEDVGALASMAKVTWSEAHQAQLGLLLKNAGPEFVFGRQGFGPWQRALLHSRAETIYGGTSEIQRNLIAKSLGLPSDRRA